MGEAYAETLDCTNDIKKTYSVVEMWECTYENLLKTNAEMRDYVSQLSIQEKLEPRDAFFGGRTNAVKLHYVAKENEQIDYYDVKLL